MSKIENKKEDIKIEASTSVGLSDVMSELDRLKKELLELRKEKKSFSDSEKEAIEKAREEMITDDEQGPCYIPDEYKEEGKTYCIANADKPNRISSLIKKGYSVVYDDKLKIGDNTVKNVGSLDGAVRVELGMTKACNGILMSIPTEKYNLRQKAKVLKIKELTDAMMQSSVDKSDFGSIEIGEESYLKR